MFAFELTYSDGISPASIVVVRRSRVRLGLEPSNHVVLAVSEPLEFEVRRGIGRTFSVVEVGQPIAEQIAGLYNGDARLTVLGVMIHILALETDLTLREGEAVIQGEVRVARRALAGAPLQFPALQVVGGGDIVYSFAPDQTVVVGRSRFSMLRIDSPEISGKHARFGYDGGSLWVEDLGSTNGTFVNGVQVAGRAVVVAGEPVSLGRSVLVYGLLGPEDLVRTTRHDGLPTPLIGESVVADYPALLAGSSAVRPARVVLKPGLTIQLGRDPNSDVWVGVPQVSRKHCTISLRSDGTVVLTDHSTNGTQYNGGGLLRRGESLEVDGKMRILDFSGGVTVALCFTKDQEQNFLADRGSVSVATDSTPDLVGVERSRAATELDINVRQPVGLESQRAIFGSAPQSGMPGHQTADSWSFLEFTLILFTGCGALIVLGIVGLLLAGL